MKVRAIANTISFLTDSSSPRLNQGRIPKDPGSTFPNPASHFSWISCPKFITDGMIVKNFWGINTFVCLGYIQPLERGGLKLFEPQSLRLTLRKYRKNQGRMDNPAPFCHDLFPGERQDIGRVRLYRKKEDIHV
jgi:hypothetical protein